MFHIRDIQIDDLDQVHVFVLKLLRQHFGSDAIGFLELNRFKQIFQTGFLKGLVVLYRNPDIPEDLPKIVWRKKDQPVGCMIYHPDVSPYHGNLGIYVDQFYIEPVFRRRGLGTRLMRALCRKMLDMGRNYIKLCFQDGVGLENIYTRWGFVNHTRYSPGLHMLEAYGKQKLFNVLYNDEDDIDECDDDTDKCTITVVPLSGGLCCSANSWFEESNTSTSSTTSLTDDGTTSSKCLKRLNYPNAQLVVVSKPKTNFAANFDWIHMEETTRLPKPEPNSRTCIFIEQLYVNSWLGPMVSFTDIVGDLSVLSSRIILHRLYKWKQTNPDICGAIWEVPCGPSSIRPAEFEGKIIESTEMDYLANTPLANKLLRLGLTDDTLREGWHVSYLDREAMERLCNSSEVFHEETSPCTC